MWHTANDHFKDWLIDWLFNDEKILAQLTPAVLSFSRNMFLVGLHKQIEL